MKISQKPTSKNGEAKSMSLLEDSLVSRSPMPGNAEARMMTATSGRICSEQYKNADPLGSLVRMLLESQRWSSKARLLKWECKPLYSERRTLYAPTNCDKDSLLSACMPTLSQSDIQSNRLLFRLAPLEPHTDETESSSLLITPTRVMSCENPESFKARKARKGYRNGTTYCSLAAQVMYGDLLKTPTNFDADSERYTSHNTSDSRGTLAQQAMMGKLGELLPTPTSLDREHRERVEELKRSGATSMQSRVNGAQRPNGLMDYLNFNGLLPTCRANQANPPLNEKMAARNKSNLEEEEVAKMQDKLLPTPDASMWRDVVMSEATALMGQTHQINLARYIALQIHPNPIGGGQNYESGKRWEHFPTVSPIHRGNDGIPFDVDSLTIPFNKWRQEALKAYGNAIVPQVMYEIFLAIDQVKE